MHDSGASRRGSAESCLRLFGCLKVESNYFRRPGQAKREPGPITTNACAKLGPQFCLQQASVVMGPRVRGDDAERLRDVIARSEATKQSIFTFVLALDCFAELVIGRAFARPVGSQ